MNNTVKSADQNTQKLSLLTNFNNTELELHEKTQTITFVRLVHKRCNFAAWLKEKCTSLDQFPWPALCILLSLNANS